jgi:hypothetical protein
VIKEAEFCVGPVLGEQGKVHSFWSHGGAKRSGVALPDFKGVHKSIKG